MIDATRRTAAVRANCREKRATCENGRGAKHRGAKSPAADWDKPANFGSRAARSVVAVAAADNRSTDRPVAD